MDSGNQVVSTVKSGVPETWYNRNPAQYTDSRNLTHTLKATLKLPAKPGRYKLAFYLKNPLGVGAQLANDIPFENGYNILETIEIG